MNRVVSIILYLVCLVPMIGIAQPEKVFLISEHKSSANVQLKELLKEKGETELIMQSIPAESINVYLYPPGDPQSIILRSFEKDYDLKDALGIPYFPEKLEVESGDTVTFSLFFDELPEEVTEIDIIERVEPFFNGFSFFNVKLSGDPQINKSLRFNSIEDFKKHLSEKKKKQVLEGFWQVDKEDSIVFKKKKWDPVLEKQLDTIALVFEENLLRSYYLDGTEYGIEFKVLEDYLSLNSKAFEEAEISLFPENAQSIKLIAEWKKTKVKPLNIKKTKKARRKMKTHWQKMIL